MIKLNLGEAQNIIGFTVGNAGPGEKVGVQTKDWFTSDHPFFYTHLKKISEIFLGLHGIFPDQVFQFLVIIHEDRTGELYLNEEVETTADMILKKNVQDGEVVYTNDIADVRRLKFNARVNEDDKVLFCFKIGFGKTRFETRYG